jgi:hypothetical protein
MAAPRPKGSNGVMTSREARCQPLGAKSPTVSDKERGLWSESRLICAFALTVAVAGMAVLAACGSGERQAQGAAPVPAVASAGSESADEAGAPKLLDEVPLGDAAEGDSVSKFRPDRIKCDKRHPDVCGSWRDDSEQTPKDGGPVAGAQRWPTQVACPQLSASSRRIEVVKLTSVLLVLKAGDIDCFDWSGSANPALMTGFALSPGTSREFSFRMNVNSFPQWTMGLNHGVNALGDFRGELAGYTTSVMQVAGAGIQYEGPCRRVPVGADPARTASTARPSVDIGTMWLWSDGLNLFAVNCWSNGIGVRSEPDGGDSSAALGARDSGRS